MGIRKKERKQLIDELKEAVWECIYANGNMYGECPDVEDVITFDEKKFEEHANRILDVLISPWKKK